jgi:hypothetical protein
MKKARKIYFLGWTAECALRTSTRTYVANTNQAGVRGGALIPALMRRMCQNFRSGWAIESTVCADCADFEVRRVCNGRTCQLQWVQVSNWESECWNVEAAQ